MSCGSHRYEGVDQAHFDLILGKVKDSGFTVEGNNPYRIDTHNHDVILNGTYDADAQVLVISPDAPIYVPCGKIWDAVDPMVIAALSVDLTPVPAPAQGPSKKTSTASGKLIRNIRYNAVSPVALNQLARLKALDVKGAIAAAGGSTSSSASSSASSSNLPLYLGGALLVAGVAYLALGKD